MTIDRTPSNIPPYNFTPNSIYETNVIKLSRMSLQRRFHWRSRQRQKRRTLGKLVSRRGSIFSQVVCLREGWGLLQMENLLQEMSSSNVSVFELAFGSFGVLLEERGRWKICDLSVGRFLKFPSHTFCRHFGNKSWRNVEAVYREFRIFVCLKNKSA